MTKKCLIRICLSIIAIVILFGCLNDQDSHKMRRVAIAQFISHPALDAARDGFIKQMQGAGFVEGKNITYDVMNAQGDTISVQNITTKVINGNYDLILTLATPISQAIKKRAVNSKTPIIYGIITDPVSAGLVNSMDKPGDNNTASSDQWPYKKQMELIAMNYPKIKKVGILMNPGEVNTQYAMNEVRKAAKELNLALIEKPIYALNDVQNSLASIINKIDIVYIPADNTAMSAAPMIIKIAKKYNIPTLAGDPGTFDSGATLGLGVDYTDLGKETANTAIKILVDKSKPGDIPVAVVRNPKLMINKKIARELNFNIPNNLLKQADKVID